MNNCKGILSKNQQKNCKNKIPVAHKATAHIYMTVLLFPSMSVNRSISCLDIAVNQHFYLS